MLPSVFRGVDSSYFGNSNSVSDSAGNRSVTNYTSSNCSNSHRVVDNCLFELLQSENDLQQLPKITDKHQLLDDDVTCYVHPLFLLCALEMALLAHESSCYSGKTVEEKSFIAILDLSESTSVTISDSNSEDVPVIDMRNNNNVNTDNLPKTQSDSLKQSACVVVVRANRAIRPFHVLLPELIRKRCSIEDHSFVRLRLVNSVDDKPCRIPKLLQLFPVEWSDESSAASSSDHATPLVKTNNILDATDGQLDMARIAFANRIEKLGNSVCCHPLVLIDQQLLSIPTNTSFGNFRSVECLNFQLELGVQRRSER